jgi:SHS2 domain-containing protein
MPFRFLPDVAIADIAFEAESDSVNGLFESSALAVSDIMVDLETLRSDTTKKVRISSEDLDRLPHRDHSSQGRGLPTLPRNQS